MDNQQRRQLMQSHQLPSLRFLRFSDHSGSSSNSDIDTSSKTDDHFIVPQDFLQQVKDLLENDEIPTTDLVPTGVKVPQKVCVEDDEIELLEPPVKEPPPCIDLDSEDATDEPTFIPLSLSLFVSTINASPISEECHVLEEYLTKSTPDQSPTIPDKSDLPKSERERVITVETSNSLNLLVLNLQIEANSENMRVAGIDRKIEELQRERKLVLERVIALKQKQIEAYQSAMEKLLAYSTLLLLDGKPETTNDKRVKTPISASLSDANAHHRPPLLNSLMQQLEDNGVDVAFVESSSKPSGSSKRKRVSNDTGDRLNKKTSDSKSTESSGPSTVAADSSKPIPTATSLVDSSQVSSSIESHVPKDSIAMPSLPSSSTEPKKEKNPKKKENSEHKSTTGPATESKKLPNEKAGKIKKLKNKSPEKKASGNATTKPTNNPASVSSAVIPQSVPAAPHPNQTVDTPATAPGNRLYTPSVAASVNQNVFKGLSMTSVKDSHDKGVRCMFVLGSILFTASEDGTVLVHDVDTEIRAMCLIRHEESITWLHAVSVRGPVNSLSKATFATCLDHLDLVTGSLDGCIRQFTMKTGECRAETPCVSAVSCVTGDKRSGKLYIGSVDGTIYSYNPKAITVDKVKYKVDREILCLKVGTYKNNRVLIISAKHKDPLVYNLITDEMVLSLITNTPNLSISCISYFGNSIFCCDASKRVFTFDWTNERPLQQVDSISSSAVSSYFWRERFLLLGCIDGTIRVMDSLGKPPTKTFSLPTQKLEALRCMKVVKGKIICGTQTGEIVYFSLAEVETIIKSVFRVF